MSALAAAPGRPLGLVHLVADLDDFAAEGHLAAACRPLIAEGLPSMQIRARGRTSEQIVRAAMALRLEAERAGCLFVVNGDVDAARYLGADGIHLPAHGTSVAEARERAPKMAVGVSCHDGNELAAAEGADWAFLSPVFPTLSKPGADGIGTARLKEMIGSAPAPVYALGGINRENAAEALESGAAGVAAIRGLRGEDGPEMLRALREAVG
ncbi:MAG TPA: thiamine phosphate synthase [bacterium]|nr:thiamine phosphate synthase [bacterium]